MFKQLIEDYRSHREGIISQGFWALTFHRFGVKRKCTRLALIRIPWAIAHIFLSKLSQMLFGIYIGFNTQIGRRCTIEHFGGIIIHSQVKIGDDVTIRQGVTIGNKSSQRPNDVPTIGNRVTIGAGAKILGNVTVGDDVAIGANAVVITDVPSQSIAVGVPARIISRLEAHHQGEEL